MIITLKTHFVLAKSTLIMTHKYSPLFYLLILADVIFVPLSGLLTVPTRLVALTTVLFVIFYKLITKSIIKINTSILYNTLILDLFLMVIFRSWESVTFLLYFVYLIALPSLFFSLSLKHDDSVYAFVFFLLCCVSLLLFFVFPTYNHENVRILIGSDNNIWFGRLVGLCCLFIVTQKFKKGKVITMLLAAFSLFVLDQTSARGPLIAFGVSMTFYFIGGWRWFYLIFVFVFPFIAVGTSALLNDLLLTSGDYSNLKRLSLYIFAIEGILQEPLFGYGLGAFERNYWDDEIRYPHNLILEVTYEYGIISTLSLVFLISLAAKKAANIDFQFLIYMLANASFSGNIFGNFILFLMLIYILTKKEV